MKLVTLCLSLCLVSCIAAVERGPSRAPRPAVRKVLNLPGGSGGRPFSHAVLAGDTLYVAGTLGLDPETGQPPAELEREIELMLDSFRAKLKLADMDMGDLVSVQVFCTDPAFYGTFNDIYRTYFPGDFPARAFLGSGELLFGSHFEINGIAVRR